MLREMEEAGLERGVFVGLSMGGYLAFELFRRAPERFLGVVLSSTRAGPDAEEAKRNRYALRERVLKEGVGFLPEALLPSHLGRTTQATKPEVVEKAKAILLEASPEAVAESLTALAERPDSTPLLSRMQVPALVLVGRRTPSPLRRRPSACGRPSPTPHAHPSGDGPPRQPGKPQGLPHRASGFPRRVLLKPEGVLEG